MLSCRLVRTQFLRTIHKSAGAKKPLDFAPGHQATSLANKTKPFSIDANMFKDSEKSAQSPKGTNRFADMFQSSKSGPKKQNANRKNHKNDERKPHRRVVRFEFNTGTLQAQAALKSLISLVHEQNTHYKVKYVDPETNSISTKFLVDISNHLDLKQHGLAMVVKEGELPLIKRVKIEDMIRSYSDRLALQKENELLEKGSSVAQRVVRQRLKAEKKKSAAKTLTIFWKISVGDLRNQKKSEIQRKLNKGEKFTLYLKSKSRFSEELEDEEIEEAPNSAQPQQRTDNILHFNKFKDEQELNIELKRREMIFDELKRSLDEMACTYKVEGKLETRYAITVTPTVTPTNEVNEVETKDTKKQRKQEKLVKQQEKKAKKQEVDLDSLYSFKIED